MDTSIESGYFSNNGGVNGWEGNVIYILKSPMLAVVEITGLRGRIVCTMYFKVSR